MANLHQFLKEFGQIIIIIIIGQFIKRRNIAEVITRALMARAKKLLQHLLKCH